MKIDPSTKFTALQALHLKSRRCEKGETVTADDLIDPKGCLERGLVEPIAEEKPAKPEGKPEKSAPKSEGK